MVNLTQKQKLRNIIQVLENCERLHKYKIDSRTDRNGCVVASFNDQGVIQCVYRDESSAASRLGFTYADIKNAIGMGTPVNGMILRKIKVRG